MLQFICQFCGRETTNMGANAKHEKHCKQNPNYVKAYRSPLAGWTKGKESPLKGRKFGRNPKWDEKYPLEKIMIENSTYARKNLKKRILSDNLIQYKCACCGIGPEWNGKPMPLILDHINGINNDNRLENLRFVCSNCDTQLDTYKSRNKKNKGGLTALGAAPS